MEYVKNWSIRENLKQNGHENAQKQHLCAFFSRMSYENAQTLHNLEETQRDM